MQNLIGINLVIASGSENVQNFLRDIFVKRGADVVLYGFMDLDFVSQLEHNVTADVILIDMNDTYDDDEVAFDRLLDKVDLPILFHENTVNEINDSSCENRFSAQEVEKLVIKLAELANRNGNNNEQKSATEFAIEESAATAPEYNDNDAATIENTLLNVTVPSENSAYNAKDISEEATNVWVLGASIGGPEAVKRFLARIPAELPVAFVLAQHLGDGFVALLAKQLDNISRFTVKEGIAGEHLRHGEVVIMPVDEHMILDARGHIKFTEENWQGHYKPSIDSVIDNIINYYKEQSGVIIFSGMGADGVLACQRFSEQYEGQVWAQSSDTCVISSMPDSARKADLVSYSGSPEALALKIAVHYMGKNAYIV